MPYIYRNLTLSPHDSESSIPSLLASRLFLPVIALRDIRIIRKGIDARKKLDIKLIFTVSFSIDEAFSKQAAGNRFLEWQPDFVKEVLAPVHSQKRIIIVGSGPAGLFSALRLAQYGLTATLIERGEAVEQRSMTVQRFWKEGILNAESNVQFGEGGAGTFSDGKLTSRSRDPLVPWILEQLVAFGAEPELRYLAKPHIGTDRLRSVVSSIRQYLIGRGFTYRFGCRMSDMVIRDGKITSLVLNDSEELTCDHLILACGHSARDTYELLERLQVPMQQKPFAMGLRIEHPQELINRIQYGKASYPALPAADYAVTWNDSSSGRSAYSFCMCPGGVVVGSASETGGVVTNGMSGQLRNSPYANSALVVNVREADFEGIGPLAGISFQRIWEQRAFAAGGGGYRAPAQNLLDFLRFPGKGPAKTTYRPGVCETELESVLPPFIIDTLRRGIVDFERRLRGFVTAEATLIGIESRTSSPVRILRDACNESVGFKGLYPAGEGAGYAGGIMSSAVDGIKIADVIAGRVA